MEGALDGRRKRRGTGPETAINSPKLPPAPAPAPLPAPPPAPPPCRARMRRTGICTQKKTNPKICYKDHTWRDYLTGYWGYEAVCGGAICEMEPGLALALTPQPYRSWWAPHCKVVQCKFNPRRLQEAKSGQLRGTFV